MNNHCVIISVSKSRINLSAPVSVSCQARHVTYICLSSTGAFMWSECILCVSEEDEEEPEPMTSTSSGGKVPSSRSGGTGGSHIHLWQFLKELLSSPQLHGSCIRWLDRSKGVFKIEDSVRVARLWGKRKNRPAMNYDKLSRSIRQYYKKGIMKKTERSQRLVYQFCHPYCL